MKLEVGKFYKTSGGHKARIYALDGEKYGPIHGAVLSSDGSWNYCLWYSDGSGVDYFDDIVGEWSSEADVSLQEATSSLSTLKVGAEVSKCECGGASVGAGHSPWCPAFEGKK